MIIDWSRAVSQDCCSGDGDLHTRPRSTAAVPDVFMVLSVDAIGRSDFGLLHRDASEDTMSREEAPLRGEGVVGERVRRGGAVRREHRSDDVRTCKGAGPLRNVDPIDVSTDVSELAIER